MIDIDYCVRSGGIIVVAVIALMVVSDNKTADDINPISISQKEIYDAGYVRR